jgi:DNA polymerase
MPHTATEANPPDTTDLRRLRAAAADCQACPLYRDATQTVFGEGSADARVVVVGEQPGDREDVAGEPFVGPAGRLLDKAFEEAGFDRRSIYLTNAVKHFKFTPAERGKRRIHQKPSRGETVACRPWLLAELASVRPDLLVALGATAAQSLLGAAFRLTRHRGERVDPPEEIADFVGIVIATVHPSAVLRAPDRAEAYAAFLADLKAAHDLVR